MTADSLLAAGTLQTAQTQALHRVERIDLGVLCVARLPGRVYCSVCVCVCVVDSAIIRKKNYALAQRIFQSQDTNTTRPRVPSTFFLLSNEIIHRFLFLLSTGRRAVNNITADKISEKNSRRLIWFLWLWSGLLLAMKADDVITANVIIFRPMCVHAKKRPEKKRKYRTDGASTCWVDSEE